MATTEEVTNETLSLSDIETELGKDLPESKEDELKIISDEEVIEEEKPEEEEVKIDDEPEVKVEIDENEYVDIPKRQEILKAFPELFKKFPGVEKAIYREQQYADIFTTPADAKEAAESVEQFNVLQQDVLSGNIENLLNSVKRADEKTFNNITESFLETLAKVNPNAHHKVLSRIVKDTINTVFANGEKDKNDQLKIAAQLFHKFFFNEHNVTPSDFRAVKDEKDNPEVEALKKERYELETTKFTNALTDVTERTDSAIERAVQKSIDPKSVMSDYVKSKAVKDVMDKVHDAISSDKRFKGLLDKHWESARNNNYNKASMDMIRKTVLTKAETILSGIVNTVKADALKGQASRTRSASEDKDERPITRGKPASPNTKSSNPKEIPRGMSTLDFLNS